MPVTALVLSTPEGVPSNLLNLWDRSLFSTVRSSTRDSRPSQIGIDVSQLHAKILTDHQKTWYQLNQAGFDLIEDASYREAATDILESLTRIDQAALVDPLLCFFSPIWESRSQPPVYLFYFSDPAETAVRLQALWRFPIEFGLALWEYYVVSAFRHIEKKKVLLFSSSKFRESPNDYMEHITQRYLRLSGETSSVLFNLGPISKSEWDDSANTDVLQDYLSGTHTWLYEELESERVESILGASLSTRTSDILFHYGNLRAGYEKIKNELHSIKHGIVLEKSQPPEIVPPKKLENKFLHSQPQVQKIKLTVRLKHMEPVEFIIDSNNPIIDTLIAALSCPPENSAGIVHLDCYDSHASAFYFSISDLIGLDTSSSMA